MTAGLMLPWPVSIVTGQSTGGAGLANVLTPNPREAFVADAGAVAITLDLGAVLPVDTFFLGCTDAGPAATFSVTMGIPAGGNVAAGAFLTSYRRQLMRHAVGIIDQPVMARYVTLRTTGPMTIGAVAVGLSFRAGHEWGSGRTVNDTGRADRLTAGFGIEGGTTAGGWSWTFGALTDDDVERLYALSLDAGVTSTVLAFESAGSTRNEAYHWGLLTKLEPYSRQAPDESTWSVQVQDW